VSEEQHDAGSRLLHAQEANCTCRVAVLDARMPCKLSVLVHQQTHGGGTRCVENVRHKAAVSQGLLSKGALAGNTAHTPVSSLTLRRVLYPHHGRDLRVAHP
jgi:hypothetical protein